MSEWIEIYCDVEDRLIPQLQLDAWERAAYYHLLRQTRLMGESTKLFSIDPLAAKLRFSNTKIREVLRSLAAKGCTSNEVTRFGYKVTVLLPDEMPLSALSDTKADEPIDVETIDFYESRRYLSAVLRRENGSCFYCLLGIAEDQCELDHVIPTATILDNSYRNIVACCHACNRKKGQQEPASFIRSLFRAHLLNEEELQCRLDNLALLQSGLLVPSLSHMVLRS